MTQNTAHESTLLTTPEAAKYLRLSPKTLEKWRCKGGGPPFVAYGGRLRLYDKTDLDAWLEQQKRASTSDPGPEAA